MLIARLVMTAAALMLAVLPALGQDREAAPRRGRTAAVSDPAAEAAAARIAEATQRGIELLLSAQEGELRAEWPYEGVYRVRGQIPIGYRVGGTAIAASALLRAPGYVDDQQRIDAVGRAAAFVCGGIHEPLMSVENYDGGYDVRGWGYAYGLGFLLELKSAAGASLGKELAAQVEEAIAFYLDGIHKHEIPQAGGWNYARQPGRETVSPHSSFMTAATLQVLFQARGHGYVVDEAVVERGLAALERARLPSGAMVYSGDAAARARDGVPGAVGRMIIAETTLALAGRSTVAQVRGAIDAFITHWEWLDKRRAQPGTHAPPYGVAPYYFYFAHYYAAQAVELLPENERAEYRRRINDLLFSVRQEDGAWNDRVFPRSASYGTAMAMKAMLMPVAGEPARWDKPEIAAIPAAGDPGTVPQPAPEPSGPGVGVEEDPG